MHTAAWKKGTKLKNKKVAPIGIGSSGVQVLPNIQPHVTHVYHFIRRKTWITPSFAAKYAGPNGANFEYTQEQKDAFRNDQPLTENSEFDQSRLFAFHIIDLLSVPASATLSLNSIRDGN